jgi:glycosyltransferase involved in cell wall biosynthesis
MNTSGKISVSVLIPTRNEERNIGACLDAVAWAGEVIVFDSLSTDATIDIAREKGAAIVSREFDNFSDHKNWALANIEFQHDWILIVDADERVTPELAGEIGERIENPGPHQGYFIARKNIFGGKWIRRAGMYPDWQLRLVMKGRARYERRIVHEHMVVDGSAGHLRSPLVHYDYKGIERYIDRHNTYSSLEAVEAHRYLAATGTGPGTGQRIAEGGPERRRRLKQFAYRWLPLRPLFVFVWMYLVKLGFLDGKWGLRYCILRAVYEFQIDLKREELARADSPLAEKYRDELER